MQNKYVIYRLLSVYIDRYRYRYIDVMQIAWVTRTCHRSSKGWFDSRLGLWNFMSLYLRKNSLSREQKIFIYIIFTTRFLSASNRYPFSAERVQSSITNPGSCIVSYEASRSSGKTYFRSCKCRLFTRFRPEIQLVHAGIKSGQLPDQTVWTPTDFLCKQDQCPIRVQLISLLKVVKILTRISN